MQIEYKIENNFCNTITRENRQIWLEPSQIVSISEHYCLELAMNYTLVVDSNNNKYKVFDPDSRKAISDYKSTNSISQDVEEESSFLEKFAIGFSLVFATVYLVALGVETGNLLKANTTLLDNFNISISK